VSMTNSTNRVEIITSVRRRRRWTAPEKVRMVEETFEPGMTVSLVAPSAEKAIFVMTLHARCVVTSSGASRRHPAEGRWMIRCN